MAGRPAETAMPPTTATATSRGRAERKSVFAAFRFVGTLPPFDRDTHEVAGAAELAFRNLP
jgi:hypothetical protein